MNVATPLPQEETRRERRWFHRKSANFSLLLPLILLNLVVLGFEEYHPYLIGIYQWLALITLVLTLQASKVRRAYIYTVSILALIAGTAWRYAILHRGEFEFVIVVCFNVLIALAPIAILRQVRREFAEEGVGSEVVLGALCAYMYIGSWFAFIYRSVALLTDAPFFAQPGAERPLNYMYFSLITLTTTGYGDLSPAYGLGRMLAAVEAVVGQLYLVTVVALIVAAYRYRR